MSEEATQSIPVWTEFLKSMVAVVFRHKMPMLKVFTAVVGIVALVTFLIPRRYESHMKVFVKNERADLVVSPDARDAGQARGDVNETQVNSEIELLTSNDLLVRVVRACRLYEHAPSTMPAAGEPDPKAIERAVHKLQSTLKITAVRKANIIQINYTDASPELAVSVLKELSAAYLDAHLSMHGTAGSQVFFRNQTLHYETELHDAESRLTAFRRQRNLTSIAEQRELLLRKTMDFESEVRQADATIAETSSRVHELRGLPEPEQIYQLLHPDLPIDFPPLKSLNVLPNNLTQQVTSFVGREKELASAGRRGISTGELEYRAPET